MLFFRITTFTLTLVISLLLFVSVPAVAMSTDKEFSVTINIEPESGGYVRIDDGEVFSLSTTGMFVNGAVVKLTAIAAEGYIFSSWQGDIVERNDIVIMQVISDMSVTARFVRNYLLPFPVWIGIFIIILILGSFLLFLKMHSRH